MLPATTNYHKLLVQAISVLMMLGLTGVIASFVAVHQAVYERDHALVGRTPQEQARINQVFSQWTIPWSVKVAFISAVIGSGGTLLFCFIVKAALFSEGKDEVRSFKRAIQKSNQLVTPSHSPAIAANSVEVQSQKSNQPAASPRSPVVESSPVDIQKGLAAVPMVDPWADLYAPVGQGGNQGNNHS